MKDISQVISAYIKSIKKPFNHLKGLYLSENKAYLSDGYSCYILDYTGDEKWLKMAKNGLKDYPIDIFNAFMVNIKATQVDFPLYKDIVHGEQKHAINGVKYARRYLLLIYELLGDNFIVYQEQKHPEVLKIYSDKGFGVIAPIK